MQLVIVHGAGGSGLSFTYQTRHFPSADAVDLPGHPKGKPCPDVEAYTEWVRGYIWGRGYQDVVLMGHSMGGAIAITYALRYPEELRGLILSGTGARLRVHPQTLADLEAAVGNPGPWLEQRAQGWAHLPEALRHQLMERAKATGPAVQLHDMRCCDRFDRMEAVSDIRVPTLVLVGSEDVMTPVKYAEYLAKHIPGTRRLVVVPGGTHGVYHEKPEEVNAAIQEFLASL
mgnify:CR=1 FL=1